jgi:two-component system, chemotaxis family, response regulator Rcp1
MSAPQGRAFYIVLLEDNPGDVYLFRQALKNAGLDFELTVIEDGAVGLAYAKRQGEYQESRVPDLAVLDLNLPKGDGETVLVAMRQRKELERVPVIIMTSSATPREQANAKALGVERFITKPTNLEEFMQIGDVVKELLMKSVGLLHIRQES